MFIVQCCSYYRSAYRNVSNLQSALRCTISRLQIEHMTTPKYLSIKGMRTLPYRCSLASEAQGLRAFFTVGSGLPKVTSGRHEIIVIVL